jgi:hypothetical protein
MPLTLGQCGPSVDGADPTSAAGKRRHGLWTVDVDQRTRTDALLCIVAENNGLCRPHLGQIDHPRHVPLGHERGARLLPDKRVEMRPELVRQLLV